MASTARSGTTLSMLESRTKPILSVQRATRHPLDTLCTNTALDETEREMPHNISNLTDQMHPGKPNSLRKMSKCSFLKIALDDRRVLYKDKTCPRIDTYN